MIEKPNRGVNPLVRRGAPGRDRTCDHRIRRVTDRADYGFYLLLCLQLSSLELLECPDRPRFLSRFLSRRAGIARRPARPPGPR
jgi:hypothetical protein